MNPGYVSPCIARKPYAEPAVSFRSWENLPPHQIIFCVHTNPKVPSLSQVPSYDPHNKALMNTLTQLM